MHWAMKTANAIIERYPNEEVYVCASGISPTSDIDVGNFREAVTTYFIMKALGVLGKRTRFIFSWDDYDVFRNVPEHLPSTLSQYIGMPLIDVPDPFGCHTSFAAHYENEFEEALTRYGIHPEFINQSDMYKSGVYSADIKKALTMRKTIFDILYGDVGVDSRGRAREDFYPIQLYCRSCLTNRTTVKSYDAETNVISYECACGHKEVAEIESINRIKLTWKVDWAMRWQHEKVCFEPGGHKHSKEGGSFEYSNVISEKIFGRSAPYYMPYDLTGIKSKLSKKTGKRITPNELLDVYPPEIILFLFAKQDANEAFDIDMDEGVIESYTEYERYSKSYHEGKIDDEDLKFALELSNVSLSSSWFGPRFSVIASAMPLINYDMNTMENLLMNQLKGRGATEEQVKEKMARASYWLNKWQTKETVVINEKPSLAFINRLKTEERQALTNFKALLESATDLHDDGFTRRLKMLDAEAYRLIYQLALGQDTGPNLSMLVEIMGREKLINLLSKI